MLFTPSQWQEIDSWLRGRGISCKGSWTSYLIRMGAQETGKLRGRWEKHRKEQKRRERRIVRKEQRERKQEEDRKRERQRDRERVPTVNIWFEHDQMERQRKGQGFC